MNSFVRGIFACAALIGAAVSPVMAQDYPSRPVRILIGLSAGGGADIICRYFAEQLAKVADQTVVVENRPGAGGNLATQAVATSKPDGYTLLFSTSNPLTGNFYLYKNLSFSLKDFAPVTTLARAGFVLVVPGTSNIHTVADLTKSLKAKGGRARYGAPTSISLASAEIYLDAVGATATRVPYKASAMAVGELAAGDLDFFFIDSTGVQGPAERGQVRMLAVTSPQRLSFAPQVPTMDEEGVKDFDMTAWFAIFTPAQVPKDIRDKLETWLNVIVKKPETAEFLKRAAAEPYPGNPDVLMATVRSQTDKYRKLSEAGKLPLAAN